MILFIGNCQALKTSKAQSFEGVETRYFLFRTPRLSDGLPFTEARAWLEGKVDPERVYALLRQGELSFVPSRADVKKVAPDAIVCSMFHEGTCFEHGERGDLLSLLDTPRTRAAAGLFETVRDEYRPLDFRGKAYVERFETFVSELKAELGCPVVVLARLRHYPIFGPAPVSSLSDWDEESLLAEAMYRRLECKGVILVNVNRIAAGILSGTGRVSSVCDSRVISAIDTDGSVSYSWSLDLEHLDGAVWERTADLVGMALSTGSVRYRPDEVVPDVWDEPSADLGVPCPPAEVLRDLAANDNERQRKALLEIARGTPVSGARLSPLWPGLRMHVELVYALAHAAGHLDSQTLAELKAALEGHFGEMEPGKSWAYRLNWSDACRMVAGLYAEAGDKERARTMIGLALACLPAHKESLLLAINVLGWLPVDVETRLRDVASGDHEAAQTLAVYYRKVGKAEEASSLLRSCLDVCGENPQPILLRELAVTLYGLGRKQEAFSTLARLSGSDQPSLPGGRMLIAMDSWNKRRTLVILLAPVMALDYLLSRLPVETDVLASESVVSALPGVAGCRHFFFPRSGLSHDATGNPIGCGLEGEQYEALILVVSRFSFDDYRNGVTVARSLVGRGMIAAFSLEQIWTRGLEQSLIFLLDTDGREVTT